MSENPYLDPKTINIPVSEVISSLLYDLRSATAIASSASIEIEARLTDQELEKNELRELVQILDGSLKKLWLRLDWLADYGKALHERGK